jgi:precorrin-2/cobalt-factor-2 C20-methyltransferase
MGIAGSCAFARHVGMDDEVIHSGVHNMDPEKSLGYLATMLIRKSPAKRRHEGAPS